MANNNVPSPQTNSLGLSDSGSNSIPDAPIYQLLQAPSFMNDVDSRQVIFILDNLPDYQALADAAPAGSGLVLLDGKGDAVQQMADYLATLPVASVEGIHLFSHGSSGSLDMGATSISADNLEEYRDTLSRIGLSLSESGDILLYGCNVASGTTGIDFINRLSQLTHADIAASNDLTGNGGDWILEEQTGDIDTQALSSTLFNTTLAAPTLSVTGGSLTYTEGDDAVDLFSGVVASTVDTVPASPIFIGLTLTVTNVADGASEVLRFAGSKVPLVTSTIDLTESDVGNVTVTLVDTTATVTITGMIRNNDDMKTLIESITYKNTSEAPTIGNRVVTLTEVRDNGGTDGIPAYTGSAATVTVQAVNDLPTSTNDSTGAPGQSHEI